MRILITAGTWNHNGGKPSGLIAKMADIIMQTNDAVCFYNGGNYENLQKILDDTPNFDIVFWFANISNDLPKIRDVKSIAPHVMLITSKRNDDQKYSFQELVQRTLAVKANLTFEFSKQHGETPMFNIRVFDPLGCQWYNGLDMQSACNAAMERLTYLKSITRQSSTPSSEDKDLVLKYYFDCFQQNMQRDTTHAVTIPDETEFIALVREYAQRFHEIMQPAPNVRRFLGNCSIKPMPPQVGRCSKGMPSFKYKDHIFVSQRNVNKEYLDIQHFVPVYMSDGKIYYCGENKPSVDTPIQLRLYQALPNIRYMIHSHCYVENADFTTRSIPCGAIEETDEILQFIDEHYKTRNADVYRINLIGHGSIIMANTINNLKNVKYFGRPMPEPMT